LFKVRVSSSPVFKWFIILFSLLTLSWKLVGGEQTSYESKINIAEFLSRHKFDITEQIIVGGLPVIDATAGACRMIVVETSPDGWTNDIIRHIIGTLERQFVVFRGNVYTKQPTWLTITDHWWSKSLRQLGLTRTDAPVIAVSATASCDAERLPWDELLQPRSIAHGS
jgi:hypothetical protein